MQEQDGDGEPAHHARRPMNAFLIFCKRHRSVVRDKYPNLENRSITKILGEWWANLEKEEKACYTGLAKQYKDAFFNANPDFKWYKLPAPPLRTLASRPRDHHDPPAPPHPAPDHHEPEKTNNNSTKLDLNKNTPHDMETNKTLSMFTPGKLADEAHMGGLSSLLATKTDPATPNPYYSPPTYKHAISTPNDTQQAPNTKAKEESIRELQHALSETTKVFEDDFDGQKPQFTNQDVIDQIVDKRYLKDDEKNWSDDDKKSGRSCKGKRYQEFMAVGGLIVNKRQKRDYNDKMTDEDYAATYGWEPGTSFSEESVVTDESKRTSQSETSAEHDMMVDTSGTLEPDGSTNKTYKPSDFDLDTKIKALPSLSLEKFQQKKRENKRKKKTINKPKPYDSSQIINSVPSYYDDRRSLAASWRETMTGSQKRKPRKISITRFEINSAVSNDNANKAHKISPEIKIATEAPCTVVQNMEFCKQPAVDSVDLFALATLAEVASNTSRIEEHTILSNMAAKGNDGNASKV